MGGTDIPVPVAFYKVLFDLTEPVKMIGFVVPNRATKRSLRFFAVAVDDVEQLTGLDFFSNLDDEIEDKLESDRNFDPWFEP